MLSLWRSGTPLVGSPFYAWCVTNGATAAALGFTPQLTTGGWPRGAAPPAPPQSHLQRPLGSQSPPTWSKHARPSCPGTASPTIPFLSIRPSSPPPPSPDEHCCPRTCLRERQIPAVQLQQHPSLPRRTSCIATRCWSPAFK